MKYAAVAGEVFADIFAGRERKPFHQQMGSDSGISSGSAGFSSTGSAKKLKSERVKLSIDDLIDLHMQRKLYSGIGQSGVPSFYISNGDYYVDKSNPIIHTVLERLHDIDQKIGEIYDIKILEDHLDNLSGVLKEGLVGLYMLSGLGLVHVVINKLAKKGNPFENSFFYNAGRSTVQWTADFLKERDLGELTLNAAKKTGRGALIAGKGFGMGLGYCIGAMPWLVCQAGKGIYKHTIIPAVKVANPRHYPMYAYYAKKNLSQRVNDFRERKNMSREERKETREQKRKNIEAKKLFKKQERQSRREMRAAASGKFWNSLKESFSKWYQDSFVNEYFGYSVRLGKSFDNLKPRRLKYITDVCDVGRIYPDFIQYLGGWINSLHKHWEKSLMILF